MSVKTDIKTILAESDVTITKVADEISRITGKRCTQSNISQKLSRGTLKYEEAKLIGQILGYELKFVRTKSYI
ncbi:LLM class flavin-dependent oxidoreductase [bacterium]|nr:LLM class flavin-dependent oxidoreductase [bacterium]